MTTQATATLAIVVSIMALCIALLAASYLYFAISHYDEHVYVERSIDQINKFARTRCTGSTKEACAILVPIEKPPGYARYKLQNE